MLRQSYDNYIEKEHNKLYQAVTQGSSIFIQLQVVSSRDARVIYFYSIISCACV